MIMITQIGFIITLATMNGINVNKIFIFSQMITIFFDKIVLWHIPITMHNIQAGIAKIMDANQIFMMVLKAVT
jgi:hypothetical protein